MTRSPLEIIPPPIPEDRQPAQRPFTPQEAQLFAAAERVENREFIDRLPHEGFVSEEQRSGIVDLIDAVGIPPTKMTSLRYVPKQPGAKEDGILASWGTGKENAGQFSIHELFYKMPAEKQVGVAAHELGHGASPLRAENADLYGGETERAEAAQLIADAAGQSLITGKYLDGYQAYLAKQLKAGQIDIGRFTEETGGILTELALTNREKLRQVQTAQHNKVAKMQHNGTWPSDRDPIALVSSEGPDGHTEPAGIDKQLITLMPGIKQVGDIEQHVTNLKDRFYPKDSSSEGRDTAAIARGRAEKQALHNSRWRMMREMQGSLLSRVAIAKVA